MGICINLNEYESTGARWIGFYVNAENVAYFDSSFGVEHNLKEISKSIRNKDIANLIQAYNSVTCLYFCIGSIDFILKGKSLLEYTHLFSPSKYKKNGNRY